MDSEKAMACGAMRKVTTTKANGRTARLKDMGCISGRMETNMKGNGLTL
jgi:hypothetical protein